MNALILLSALIPGFSAASSGVAGPSASWSLVECLSESVPNESVLSVVREQMTDPRSPTWVPFPFPHEQSQVVEDFFARHELAYSDMREDELPEGERRLFSLKRKGGLRTRVSLIANWTPQRCLAKGEVVAYWLIQFTDSTTQAEITRAALLPSGLVSMLIHAQEDYAIPPLPSQNVLQDNERWGLEADATSVQFVTAWGPRRCHVLRPCVAWRTPDGALVLQEDRVLRVRATSTRYSYGRSDLASDAFARAIDAEQNRDRQLLSLGGDVWVAADVQGLAGQASKHH